MENGAPQNGMHSLHGVSLFSSALFVMVAAMVAVTAIGLLLELGTPQMVLPGEGRVAQVVMILGFSGVLVSRMLHVSDTTRRTLVVLFSTGLLCSGFVVLVAWFAVSGASSSWL
jgi:hypothetical protein